MLRLFQDSFIFEEATSSYFFRVITLTQQLLFRSSYFFRSSTFFDELLFQNSHFFAAVIFSEQLLFQSETPTEPLLENRKFFRVVTFWNSYLSGGGIVQNEDIYRRDTFLKQVRSIKCFRRATFLKKTSFSEKQYPALSTFFWRATFLDMLLFQTTLSSLQQLFFQKRYVFTTYFFRKITISVPITYS